LFRENVPARALHTAYSLL